MRNKIREIEEQVLSEIASMNSRNTSVPGTSVPCFDSKNHRSTELSLNSTELDNNKSFKTIEVINDDESVEGIVFGESMFNNQIFAMDVIQLSSSTKTDLNE